MRIQHNIPAMNAYRNYNNNTKALQANLQKLSSGYRINKAGDDAAGLAISEKMRAQITGLEVAQKNAKDGISLVQTAEGAMTEVHDMLNRMYELAEQSANGTYADEVDREQMQKEIESLRTEINRIADATNFNGINLLDGSLSADGIAATSSSFSDLPEVGEILGTNTVLHKEAGPVATKTSFSVDLHNFAVNGKAKEEFTLTIGTTAFTGALAADGTLTADKIVEEFIKASTSNIFKDSAGKTISGTAAAGITINGAQYKVSGSGTRLSFELIEDDAAASGTPNVPNEVTLAQSSKAPVGPAVVTVKPGAASSGQFTAAAGVSATPTVSTTYTTTQNLTSNLAIPTAQANELKGKQVNVTIGSETFSVTISSATPTDDTTVQLVANTTTGTGVTTAIKNAINNQITARNAEKAKGSISYTEFGTITTLTGGANGALTIGNVTNKSQTYSPTGGGPTKGEAVIDFTGKTGADVIGQTITIGTKVLEFVKTGDAVTVTGATAVEVATSDASNAIATAFESKADDLTIAGHDMAAATVSGAKVTIQATAAGAGKDVTVTTSQSGGGATVSGDYNKATTNIELKTGPNGPRLASTYFDLQKDMVAEGNSIKIGKESYTFTTQSGVKDSIYVGDMDLDKLTDENMTTIAERLTKAAAANKTYTVGYDKNRITVTENDGQTEFAKDGKSTLTSMKAISDSLGFTTAAQKGKGGLTLQIGDTSEKFNKITVSVNDMHAKAMGIGDIDISTQDGASEAMDAIKSAINYVSDTRGDLGATQNRLDHTINNLSVAHENIQDAEATIRDVDVAEEMMAYTKNNILVQAAQAMLAQANQLPQGVLQLLG